MRRSFAVLLVAAALVLGAGIVAPGLSHSGANSVGHSLLGIIWGDYA